MSDKPLRIIPLGGLGEIGKNMTVYEYGGAILIVDTGLMFPTADMLGVDYIIPDFRYLEGKEKRVVGIVYTHGHEDHTGAVRHVVEKIPAPLYATPLTKGLLEVKLKEAKLGHVQVHEVRPGEAVRLGPFQVEFVHVTHSIPDSVALGITTPQGLVVHTGDYKFDHTPAYGPPSDYGYLAEFGKRGVLALLGDSTNADRPGWTPSERSIEPAIEEVFRKARGRILVATFASLISRMQQVADIAMRHGRKIGFVGRSMIANAKMARKLGYLRIPEDMLITVEQAAKLPPHQVCLMITGSQGEPSSIVGRLAAGGKRPIRVEPGDAIIIAAHPIPGNTENVYRAINGLIRRGADVYYSPVHRVHVSGHGSQEEMKLMIHLTQPRFFVPVHGELRHLRLHAELAHSLGIGEERIAVVENGYVLEFQDGQMRIAERVPGGWVFVEGTMVGESTIQDIKERRELARGGLVLVRVEVDRTTGQMVGEPEVITKGFAYPQGGEALVEALAKRIRRVLRRGPQDPEQALEQALRDFIFSETRRRPHLFVVVKEVLPPEAPSNRRERRRAFA